MTLLSNAFVAPSTSSDVATNVKDTSTPPVSDNGPSESTSTPSTTGPSPSQVLAMTIKKKRKVLRSRDRNLRVEILLTSTIRRLCQEIGDHLRSRRMAGNKRKAVDEDNSDPWTPTVSQCAPKRTRVGLEGKKELMTRKRRTIPSRRPRMSVVLA